MKRALSLLILLCFCYTVKAQYTNVQPKKKRDQYIDSLKKTKYPYVFPALGQKARKQGIDVILPHGIMANGVYTKQNLKLNDLQVAFNDGAPISLDSIAKFDYITGEGYITNFRFDTYVFPFLNLYALAGTLTGHTTVSLAEPIKFTTTTSNPGQYYGLGVMLAGGFGSFWVTSDFNFAWTDLELLDHPVKTRLIGLRVGKAFKMPDHPQQNFALWVATQNQKVFNETSGKISAQDLGITGGKINDMQDQLDTWYQNLPPPKQQLYEGLYNRLNNGLADLESNLTNGSITYQFNKSLLTPWHVSLGGQWQINKHWQIRGEAGGAYKKQQYMLSVNYRFGIKGRNIMSGEKKESTPQ
ncbi:hypothetical protein C3K47_00555 [Solitalea longa]|uniref:Outer membrane protein beta-barrel domain-containing protein n=1 Tax=Solitalea longa TaxID=2079460 RepID=A0A2S5A944_9SPHI|nr:hypothetical protein [Solitalea longa]POY39024.1 hypothetical protein C3K47_00555 [Solitalea longa]